MTDPKTKLRDLRGESRAIGNVWTRLARDTERNELLTFASAVCFQILFALPPMLLAGLAILGLLDLREVWDDQLAPQLREATSPAMFDFVEQSARQILEARSGFWLTIGVVLAIWYVSGATRALMGVMNRIYHKAESRSFLRRMGVSLLLSVACSALLGLAIVLFYVSPAVFAQLDLGLGLQILAGSTRWLLNLACLYLSLFLLVRFGPAQPESMPRGSLTTLLIIASWLVTSLGFRWYVTSLADYQSVFGNLASIIIVFAYLYLSAVVLIYGLQIDAMVRGRTGEDDA